MGVFVGEQYRAALRAFEALARNPALPYEDVFEALLELQRQIGDQGLIYHLKNTADWRHGACGHPLRMQHVSVRANAPASRVFINCEACRQQAFSPQWLAALRQR